MVIEEASQCLPFWFRRKNLTTLEKEKVVIVKYFSEINLKGYG